ncbi:hypothetical protein HDA32_004281 [Spinactinospora alkalitolerans]|uniref:Uncharacterized protein n=1 Tax=Spinactinospora alkalitolerans TaxID=687207 RepID=A0A852TZC5_9ACTN|nr:hypothetical protein [Spinactinospora alkalitolerans]NYE49161.1 hypothetical protein [Spinactinospora alkalitolerans]
MSNDRPRSSSVVALLADIPSTGHLGDARAQRFTLDGDDLAAQSSDFLDFTGRQLTQGRKIVALYPKWHSSRAERAIRFARGSFQSDHIAAVPVDLAPLTLSLLADQLAYLAPYLPSGLVTALADELPNHMLAGGWLKSVSNLSTIPISVKQHMGSYAPNTTFLAFCAPAKRVGRVKRNNPSPNIPARPVEPIQMLIARPEGQDITAFNERFTPALRPVSAGALPEQPLGAKYWGARKYIEFVAFSAHPEALTHAVRALRPTACTWCREPVIGVHCKFCGAANQPPVGKPPTRNADVPPPPTKTTGEHVRPTWIAQDRRAESAPPAQEPPWPDGGHARPTGAFDPPPHHPAPDDGSRTQG